METDKSPDSGDEESDNDEDDDGCDNGEEETTSDGKSCEVKKRKRMKDVSNKFWEFSFLFIFFSFCGCLSYPLLEDISIYYLL